MNPTRRHAFTIVELLVVIGIIAALLGILLPAIGKARTQAKVTQSESNLRNLGAAHATYASEWNDRQFTLTRDDIASYGRNAREAVTEYIDRHREQDIDGTVRDTGELPPIELGWSNRPSNPNALLRALRIIPAFPRNYALLEPIAFRGAFGDEELDIPKMGYFRMPNARQFSQYLSGRFYDPVFYAPRDIMAMTMREDAADLPGEFTPLDLMRQEYRWSEFDFCYSSYSLSPAALFSPDVMRPDVDGVADDGWQDPWQSGEAEFFGGAFRAPSMSQASYSNLKTHMLEHHWLQGGVPIECNPQVGNDRLRPYKGCQPYYFNQGRSSSPAALFYDGHIELMGVADAVRDDLRHGVQAGYGLWSRDTPFGEDGYWSEEGIVEDASQAGYTSFHILTTNGIRGRDWLSGG